MGKNLIAKVAPARAGIQMAFAWRMWSQGDEFYAASSNTIQLAKISFHRNRNWQFRLGPAVFHLAPPLALSAGWLHVLQLSFLLKPDRLLPPQQKEDRLQLIDTPNDSKLVINLLLSSDSKPNLQPPGEIKRKQLALQRLRSGTSLIVTSRVMPMLDSDHALVAQIDERKVNVHFTPERPARDNVYFELLSPNFSPQTGNIIAIIPGNYERVSGDHTAS